MNLYKRDFIQKLNYKTLEYQDYTVPVNWEVKTINTNMNKKVNCIACVMFIIIQGKKNEK